MAVLSQSFNLIVLTPSDSLNHQTWNAVLARQVPAKEDAQEPAPEWIAVDAQAGCGSPSPGTNMRHHPSART